MFLRAGIHRTERQTPAAGGGSARPRFRLVALSPQLTSRCCRERRSGLTPTKAPRTPKPPLLLQGKKKKEKEEEKKEGKEERRECGWARLRCPRGRPGALLGPRLRRSAPTEGTELCPVAYFMSRRASPPPERGGCGQLRPEADTRTPSLPEVAAVHAAFARRLVGPQPCRGPEEAREGERAEEGRGPLRTAARPAGPSRRAP